MNAQMFTSALSQALPFWDRLSDAEISMLAASSHPVRIARGHPIHEGTSQCAGMLFVTSGSLRVYMLSEDGREITLYRLHSGEVCILSASCVLSTITFDVFIDAVEDAEIIQTGAAAISSLMESNIYAEAFAYRLVTERFSDVMWAMQQILFMSFDKRLAIFLLDETAAAKNDTLRMTHDQIARYIGSAREVVSRMLKYFSGEGYVSLSRGVVTITDKAGLRSLVK